MPGLPFSGWELILILGIALLVLGPGKLPELGSAVGKTIREFRQAASDVQDGANLDARPAHSPPPPTAEREARPASSSDAPREG